MSASEFPAAETVSLRGKKVSLYRAGPAGARPVLLLHGGGMDRAALSWQLLLPHLAEHRAVIAPDWPGYGGSAPMAGRHTIADFGRWLVELLDALSLDRVDIVGISMGAGVGLWLALHYPERLGRLVAAGPYGLQRRAPSHMLSYLFTRAPLTPLTFRMLRRRPRLLRRALAAIFKHPERISDALVAETTVALDRPDVGVAFWRFQRDEIALQHLRSDFSGQIQKIPHEVLFLQGDGDRLVPLDGVIAAQRRMARARLQRLDAGHWPMRELSEPFNDLVADFLTAPLPEHSG